MLNLVVGDVHYTPEEQDDCEALLYLVQKVVVEKKVDVVTFMGDQYNTHDTVSTRGIEMWRRHFGLIGPGGAGARIVALRGNHDQTTPQQAFPHAMLAHTMSVRGPLGPGETDVQVVDAPQKLPLPGAVAMPYYYDPQEFLADARKLKAAHPAATDLFCHQTMTGARYENGFYAKDAVDPVDIPFDTVISGHIHMPQKIGKAIYVGAPRWRTRSDAGQDRYVWLMEHLGTGIRPVERIPTDTVCRRIYTFEDRPEAPAPLDLIPEAKRALAVVRVDVFGPTPEYVRDREAVLKAGYRARTRGFPDRQRRAAVSEAEGVDTAFGRFLGAFVPPNGTSPAALRAAMEERLAS